MSTTNASLSVLRKINLMSERKKNALKEPQNGTEKSAMKIMQREEEKAKKSRLQSLLQQQFTARYGSKQASSDINAFIASSVARFVQGRSLAECEIDIQKLEDEIKAAISVMKTGIREKKREEVEIERAKVAKSRDRDREIAALEMDKVKAAEVDPSQWAVLNTLIALSDEDRQRQERELEARKKSKHKQELDQQQQYRLQKQLEKQMEKENSLKAIQKLQNELQLEQEDMAHKKEIMFARERQIRLEQIEQRKQEKEAERQQRIAMEQADMARARRLAEEEEERRMRKRMEEKQAQDRILEENERNKAVRLQERMKQREYETKLNRDYEEKLAKEDAARASAFQSRIDALNKISKRFDSEVGEQRRNEESATEKRTLADLERRERERAEMEEMKETVRKRDARRNFEYNTQMIEDKKRDKERARMEALEARLRLQEETRLAEAREKQLAMERKLKGKELKYLLDDQVRSHQQHISNESALSDIEKKLNKDLLEKFSVDPTLKDRVAQKLHPVTARSSSANVSNISW